MEDVEIDPEDDLDIDNLIEKPRNQLKVELEEMEKEDQNDPTLQEINEEEDIDTGAQYALSSWLDGR